MFRRALDRGLRDELLFRTLWDIAALEKKLDRVDAAVITLTELAASRNPFRAAALAELAKHYERREGNYVLALEMIGAAIAIEDCAAFRRRAARLEKRLDRAFASSAARHLS